VLYPSTQPVASVSPRKAASRRRTSGAGKAPTAPSGHASPSQGISGPGGRTGAEGEGERRAPVEPRSPAGAGLLAYLGLGAELAVIPGGMVLAVQADHLLETVRLGDSVSQVALRARTEAGGVRIFCSAPHLHAMQVRSGRGAQWPQ
jgi:hypothetical protein